MSQKISTRQLRQHTVLPMIGNSADEAGDSLLSKIDAQLSKLFEDRNVLLVGGGITAVNSTATSVSFTATLSLFLNSKVAGGAPVSISLGSTTRAFTADGNMLYAVVDRLAGTATVTADSSTLPAVTSANQEVFLIAKRVGTNIYFRNGQSLAAGTNAPIGRIGATLDTEFIINDATDATKQIAFDAAGTTGTKTTLTGSQTVNRVLTLPDATDTLVGKATVDILSNKTMQQLVETVATDSTTTGTNTTLAAFTTGIVRLTNASLTSLSGIPAGVNGQTLTIENVTGASYVLNNDEATATAADRILTGNSAPITIKDTASILLKYDGTTARWRVIGGSGSGSGSGAVNLILNPDGEAGTTGWATYADAAGSRPVDGTGGSPTVTWGTTTNTPLVGLNSFVFTKGASNTQGQGVSYQFTVDQAYRAKVLTISMDYIIRSGTFVPGSPGVDSDMIAYIYDVTNSQLIEPSSVKFLSNSSTISDKFQATFQTSATGATYRLILHCATISASAYTLGFDSITVSPSNYVYGTPITDWQSFTPTGSWSTNTTYSGKYRRVGDSAEFDINVATSGAPTAAGLSINLPVTIDTQKLASTIPGDSALSSFAGSAVDASVAVYQTFAYYLSSTSVRVHVLNSAGTYGVSSTAIVSQTIPFTFGAGDSVNVKFTVPVSGWSSSVQTSDQTDTRVVAASVQGAPVGVVSGAIAAMNQTNYDTHNATSPSRFTAPVPGYYRVSGVARLNAAVTSTLYLYKNAVLSIELTGLNDTAGHGYSSTIFLNAGDIIDLRPNNTVTFSALTFMIERISGPSAIAASESLNLRYSSTAGTTITAGTNTIQFPTKSYDTHGVFTSNTTFTAQTSGKYSIKAKITTNTLVGVSTNTISILVNGSAVSTNTYAMNYATAGGYTFMVDDDISLLAGQTVTISFSNGFGSSITMTTGTGQNVLSIVRVGN